MPKLEAKANDILKQVEAGGDFAALAKQHSDDPGSKDKGGVYESVVRGQMVPAFEQAAFSLKPMEVGNLVKTEYGFHILQVLEKEQAKLKPFEEVKAELATERKREAVYAKMQSVHRPGSRRIREGSAERRLRSLANTTWSSRTSRVPPRVSRSRKSE